MSTTAPPDVRYDWMHVGADFTDTPAKRATLIGVFATLDAGGEHGWQALPCTLAMTSGLAIEEIIRQLHVPRVTHVGVSSVFAPYGLVALRAHYSKGRQRVDLLAVDRGTHLSPLVTRVHPLTVEPYPTLEPLPA